MLCVAVMLAMQAEGFISYGKQYLFVTATCSRSAFFVRGIQKIGQPVRDLGCSDL